MKSFKKVMLTSALAMIASGAAYAQDPIALKLGVLNDRSGVYADLSGEGSVIAAQMAVEDFGAADKGMSVTIVSADHQNKPDIASNIARQWIDSDGVDLILDVPTSSAALAVAEIVREKNKIVMVSGGGTSELTGAKCSPNTVHWTYDTWALGNGTPRALVKEGLKTWFIITADYAFGHALEKDAMAAVAESGGEVLGAIKHPFPGQDFSSYLLQAQSSGAQVIGLANAGGDMINTVKQAAEFGVTQGGQTLAGLLVFITEVHALGLEAAQGLMLTDAFYWDQNDGTREWSKRFAEKHGGDMPTSVHAGVYASTLHYLKAVEAAGNKETEVVMAKMKEMPSEDPLFGKGEVRIDGRHIHDMFLYKVKAPAESTGAWDYYQTVATIPAAEAWRPLDQGGCSLVQ